MGYTMTFNESSPHLGGNIAQGDPTSFAPRTWQFLIDRFAVTSVLDLGSGSGFSAAWFFRQGLQVIAVDGLRENCLNPVYPTVHVDITSCPVITKVDLVHCQEVVEHIEERYLDNLIRSFQCGRFLALTAATPGQGGHHHVNEQEAEYWVRHLAKHDIHLLLGDTNRMRMIAQKESAMYFARTGMLFFNAAWPSNT